MPRLRGVDHAQRPHDTHTKDVVWVSWEYRGDAPPSCRRLTGGSSRPSRKALSIRFHFSGEAPERGMKFLSNRSCLPTLPTILDTSSVLLPRYTAPPDGTPTRNPSAERRVFVVPRPSSSVSNPNQTYSSASIAFISSSAISIKPPTTLTSPYPKYGFKRATRGPESTTGSRGRHDPPGSRRAKVDKTQGENRELAPPLLRARA